MYTNEVHFHDEEPAYRKAGFWVREELPELQVFAWEHPGGFNDW
jgi:hypothetical protein